MSKSGKDKNVGAKVFIAWLLGDKNERVIGDFILKKNPDANLVFVTTEKLEELIKKITNRDERKKIRRKYFSSFTPQPVSDNDLEDLIG